MRVRPFEREAGWELPASLDELVAADHAVRFIAAYIDSLTVADWEQMEIRWQVGGQGANGYHPKILLAAWLWGFMSGVRSTRRIEVLCREHLPALWLTGGQCPDHNTLWRFYQAHRAGMRTLLTQTVQVALRAGLVDLAFCAIDGTKVSGNASRDRSYTQQELDQLADRTERAIADLEAQNETDDEPPPPPLPPDLTGARARAERIAAAKEQLAASQRSRINLTDPDARLMVSRHGFVAGYNCQAAVSPLDETQAGGRGMLATAAEVITAPDDQGELLPMMDAATASTGVEAQVTAADGGYASRETIVACAARGRTVLLPVAPPRGGDQRGVDHPYHQSRFTYDQATDTYRCPEGQTLTKRRVRHQGGGTWQVYSAGIPICRACPAFALCTKDAHKGREIAVRVADPVTDPVMAAHRERMATPEATALYARRRELIEPVFGLLKEQQGLRRFLLRGREQVACEWTLLLVTFNLRTLARIWHTRPDILVAA